MNVYSNHTCGHFFFSLTDATEITNRDKNQEKEPDCTVKFAHCHACCGIAIVFQKSISIAIKGKLCHWFATRSYSKHETITIEQANSLKSPTSQANICNQHKHIRFAKQIKCKLYWKDKIETGF